MTGEMTSSEKRIRRLEEEVDRLRKAIESVGHKAGQTAEDVARQMQDDGGLGRIFMRAQAVGAISAATGAALGAGTCRLLQTISGTRYQFVPDVQVPVVQDTGGVINNNTYMVVVTCDGAFTVIVADCATATPLPAPLPPT